MPRLQFVEAQAVFDAFPTLMENMKAAPTTQPPLEYLRGLVTSPNPDDSILFSACVLPRRMAVWWVSQCVRSLQQNLSHADEVALTTAEAWVRAPDEVTRNEALRIGMSGSSKLPSTWVANAAGWSGGSIMLDNPQGPPAPPHLTAAAARNAVLLALGSKPNRQMEIAACVDKCIGLAES